MGDYGPYYSPENYGLEMIGNVNWDTNDYGFDMIVAWKRLEDGAFLWAADAGCSCPTPFEGHRLNDGIEPLTGLQEFHAMLLEKDLAVVRRGYGSEGAALVNLVTRLHEAGLR
jgi:hypothetical protein